MCTSIFGWTDLQRKEEVHPGVILGFHLRSFEIGKDHRKQILNQNKKKNHKNSTILIF